MGKTNAIVLAAGRSQRMGCCKPLLELGGRPAIRRCLDTLREAGLDEVVVVLGPDGEKIASALSGLPVILAWNRAATSDMAGSVKIGLAQADPAADNLLILPADYPLIAPQTIRILLAELEGHPNQIVIPTHQGRKGHPVIFPRPVLAELDRLPTLRDLLRRNSQRLHMIEVADPAIHLDMDTPADYQQLLTHLDSIPADS